MMFDLLRITQGKLFFQIYNYVCIHVIRYKLKDDVRISLYDAAKEWTKAIGPSRIFMGGNQPNLADLVSISEINQI